MTIIDTVRLEMQEHHEKHGSWRAVGRIIGKSPAYAQRVVRGDLEPSQEVIARWMASRSCVPVKHEQIAYPIDHDAILHLSPNGNGSLHTYTVPADAEVVVVPPGARVVLSPEPVEGQPKPPSKPARKRTRIDITGLPLNAQEARHILLWYLDIYTRIVPDGVDMTAEAAEILNAMRRHAFDDGDGSTEQVACNHGCTMTRILQPF